jgi:hypothetical protein
VPVPVLVSVPVIYQSQYQSRSSISISISKSITISTNPTLRIRINFTGGIYRGVLRQGGSLQGELKSFAKALKIITTKLQALNVDYNFFLHNVISNTAQHFYIKVQPRDSVWAGVELGSGLVINSISPEVAAKYYREK